MVFKTLLDRGKAMPQDAASHLGPPLDQLYAELEGELSQRQVAAFKEPLQQLDAQVKANPNASQVTTLYTAAMQRVDGAITAIPAPERNRLRELMLPGGEWAFLATAGGDLTAQRSRPISFPDWIAYQDSRAYFLYADALYATISERIAQDDFALDQILTSSLEELALTWHDLQPAATPILTPAQVSAQVELLSRQRLNRSNSKAVSPMNLNPDTPHPTPYTPHPIFSPPQDCRRWGN